jgi:cation transport ATPase
MGTLKKLLNQLQECVLPPHVQEAAVIVAFILLSKLLEERVNSNISSAIKKLMGWHLRRIRQRKKL